jgi:porphobilinogen synthase
MPFPSTRMRRLRASETWRGLVRETELTPAHLIQPAFVVPGEGVREGIESMPGIERFSISELIAEATEIAAAGIGAVLLFGLPAAKDETGAPVAAYQVSGEYSAIKAAGANGWIDEQAAALESLVSMRRAGADFVVTYFAKEAAAWLS